MAKLFESIGKLGLALAIGGGVVNSALYNGKLGDFYTVYLLIRILLACISRECIILADVIGGAVGELRPMRLTQ